MFFCFGGGAQVNVTSSHVSVGRKHGIDSLNHIDFIQMNVPFYSLKVTYKSIYVTKEIP